MDDTEKLLKDLTEAHGVSGNEGEVRQILRPLLEPLGPLQTDNLGSLLCEMPGDGPRIALMAHMDEIGFMVRHITEDGFIKFVPLGGWWDQVLLGHRVIIRTRNGNVLGVIGAKPPHLLEGEERNQLVKKADMYIDVGASSADQVTAIGIRPGDYITPDSRFEIMAPGKTYCCKAFDDRVGCGVMVAAMHALQDLPRPNTVIGVASVQEEVGLRGAQTSVSLARPDIGIVLESGIAGDVPGIKEDVSSQKLGGGPTIGLFDATLIAHNKLRDLIFDVAEAEGIPLQFGFMERGGTDANKIHLFEQGVPSVWIGVTARHIHSHNSIIHRDDFDNAVQLVTALVQRLDAATVAALKAFD